VHRYQLVVEDVASLSIRTVDVDAVTALTRRASA
jgi:hypothetical protein